MTFGQHLAPVPRVQRLIDLYKNGAFTTLEVSHIVIETIDSDNAQDLIRLLPNEVVSQLSKVADDAPQTDDGWGQLKLFAIHSVEPSPSGQFRRAIELVRQCLPDSARTGGSKAL